MAKYLKRIESVEALTFDEFVEYGKTVSDHIVDGMPRSFEWNGAKATHETDDRYRVDMGNIIGDFERGDYIVFDGKKVDVYYGNYFIQEFEKSEN